jgi:hypothetical protein
MDLTVKVVYLIKCCMKLIVVISHDKYYNHDLFESELKRNSHEGCAFSKYGTNEFRDP